MIEFISELHFGWWFLAHTLIMLACFTSLDNLNYKRTMLFANAIEEIQNKLDLLESKTAYYQDLANKLDSIDGRLWNQED